MWVFNAVGLQIVFRMVVVCAQAGTDSIRDADELQSGYLPNHNMDPDVVGSADFVKLWTVFTGGSMAGATAPEQFLAKPLVYTPTTRSQVVIVVSEANWIYVLDAATGAGVKKRQVRIPFNATDLPCPDLPGPEVGITGTPIISRENNALYFWAKGYNGAGRGFVNAAYWFYGVDALTLLDLPGYPLLVDGNRADNAPDKYFHGGTHLQRTALSQVGDLILAGFGGICHSYNFTGYIVAVNIRTIKITAIFATIAGADSIPQNGTWQGGGGEAGIWQSGRSFASDRAGRFFVAVSNGLLLGNYDTPRPSSSPPQILEGTIVNMGVLATGKLVAQDFFRPFDYSTAPDAARDLGSGGVTILDPGSFQTSTVKTMGLACGKAGKLYVMDMDKLGGFKNGVGGKDAVVQTIEMPQLAAVFGTIGSFGLGGMLGGYIYVKPTSGALSKVYVYKFHRENGTMSEVAQSDDTIPSYIGTGAPTVTTMDGRQGTGIVWITSRDGELNAYRAVPVDGKLVRIPLAASGIKCAKFQRPVFGNGRVYVATSTGHIVCFGKKI